MVLLAKNMEKAYENPEKVLKNIDLVGLKFADKFLIIVESTSKTYLKHEKQFMKK